ncbi:MAG: hypothetical protein JNL83_23675 [Myxococcales bacterium]|nr:hypothetical protein [Myxococcales bacterium]
MKRLALLLAAAAACGDQIEVPPTDEPTSGTRLKAEWLFYGDGSRQIAPAAYYDTALHIRCTPRDWADGTVRCVPEADLAYYTDDVCETAAGYAEVIGKPRHFLALDRGVPAVIYHSSTTAIDPPAQIYELFAGECMSRGPAPADFPWFEISGVGDVVELTEREIAGDDRLALRVRESADGLHVPLGLRDTVLDLPCRPDGDACIPAVADVSDVFLDDLCEVPGVGVPLGAEPPPFVRLEHAGDCPTFHRVGAQVTGSLYRRTGASCRPAFAVPTLRGYALGAAIEPAPLARELEEPRGSRLRSIALSSGGLRIHDTRMFDTATRAECVPTGYEGVTRCTPASVVPAITLFAAGCRHEVRIAEVPERSCSAPPAFATYTPPEVIGPDLHAIGATLTTPLYDVRTGGCVPYVAPMGVTPHVLGPTLPPDTFVGGHPAGER